MNGTAQPVGLILAGGQGRRMAGVDKAVLDAIGGQVLAPDIIADVVTGVLAALAPENRDGEVERLRTEWTTMQVECGRWVEAIASGGDMPVLVQSLQARQTRLRTLQEAIGKLGDREHNQDAGELERHVRERLEHWRELLTEQTQAGRGPLRQILVGPIRFTPVERDGKRGYSFSGEVALATLLAGVVDVSMSMASPTGFARAWTREIPGTVKAA